MSRPGRAAGVSALSSTRPPDADGPLDLRCPVCGAVVSFVAPSWRCDGAPPHSFSDVAGIPVLLNPGRSLFRSEDFRPQARTTFKDPPRWALWLGRVLPSPSRDVSAARCSRRVAQLLKRRPQDRRRILVVGCGDGHARYGALGALPGARWLETDVSLAGSARVVCDASDLPFADASFDAVVCTAVLEHVLEPQRCVDEMHRVLADSGVIWATTPFMQQVHMGEYDFTRFTRSGHRWLFRAFHEVESGIATGPASVLVWSVEYFMLAWTASVPVRRVIKGITRLLLGWLTLLDGPLARRAAANDAAGGHYFIGQRSEDTVITARDMLGYYRGADQAK